MKLIIDPEGEWPTEMEVSGPALLYVGTDGTVHHLDGPRYDGDKTMEPRERALLMALLLLVSRKHDALLGTLELATRMKLEAALNTECSSCGATEEACDAAVAAHGRGCCGRCYRTDTHHLTERGKL